MAGALQLATLALLGAVSLGLGLRLESKLEPEQEPVPIPAYLHFSRKRELRAPPPPPPTDHRLRAVPTPTAKWFDQHLDHFDPTETRTWKQRWFTQTSFYKENGPVFLFIEGEGEASPTWLVRGHTAEMAEKFGAVMFQLEHRFYGQSHPFEDMSTPNLRWLTSEQALADLAYFLEYLKTNGYYKDGAKVVAFGGSYPGNLAAWVRIKYPHLVFASVSSSGPVLAKADFVEYLEVVGNSLTRKAGQWCVDNIKKGVERAKQLITSGADGVKTVLSTFRACSNIDLSNPLDLQSFYGSTGNAFSGAVQYNRPVPGTGMDTINTYCSRMGSQDQTLTDDQAMQKLAAVILWDASVQNNSCMDYSYNATIKALSNVVYGNGYDASRLWTYQTCTEFGYYQTDDSTDQPFGENLFPLSLFTQQCTDTFGKIFNESEVNYGVDQTNMQYGGRDLEVDRTVFVNGDIDPWHSLSRLTAVNSRSPAIPIRGTSHCYDMQPTSSTDPSNLTAARLKIQNILENYLYDSPDGSLPNVN